MAFLLRIGQICEISMFFAVVIHYNVQFIISNSFGSKEYKLHFGIL